MKKLIVIALSGMMSVLLLAGCTNSSASSTATNQGTATVIPTEVTITDHQDRTITVPADPKKVAVLDIYPLASMLTIYLDSSSSIVAMEPASMSAAKNGVLSELYPEILNVNTNIMDGNDVNIESLIALNPDVVFYNAGNKAEQQKLENAGLTAVAVSATKWNYDCIKTYNEWMSLLNQIYPSHASNREDLVKQYATKKYDEIQSKVSSISTKQKVLFLYQYDAKTMITSSSSFFGQWWCDAVGAENVAHGVQADNSNAQITMEQVYAWNPDVIIITNFTPTKPEDLYDNAIGSDDWSTIKAVQDKRVYKMPLGSYRTYTPGIDTPMTLEWLAQAVYPEIFKDYNIASDVKDYYQTLFHVELTDEQIKSMYTANTATGKFKN